jgi:hypothetical protein
MGNHDREMAGGPSSPSPESEVRRDSVRTLHCVPEKQEIVRGLK